MDKIYAGLIGFGTIGAGVARVLTENTQIIKERLGVELVLKRIADLDITSDRGVEIDKDILTTNAADIIDDPQISIVIELVGGYEPAKSFILSAIKKGKHVVTANKALLSSHGKEIFESACKNNIDVAFEASVGGGIPIIKSIKESLCANRIESLYGIINGTANYILSKMTNEGDEYDSALKTAQSKGYAEADPTFDVEGVDTVHKLAILVSICFGVNLLPDSIFTEGITQITPVDIEFAKEFDYRIKLLAIAKVKDGALDVRVHPTMIPANHPLAGVDGVFNAIYMKGDALGPAMFFGKGAGMMPTASAVVGDVIDISRNIISGSHMRVPPLSFINEQKNIDVKETDDVKVEHYLRFTVVDSPGVLSAISGILGDHDISISSVIQKGRSASGAVPVVVTTHHAVTKNLKHALNKIDGLDVVLDRTLAIKIEDNLED